MNRNTWKSGERKLSKMVGGERNPLSGRNSKHTSADVIHPYLYVEYKHLSNIPKQKAIAKLLDKVDKQSYQEPPRKPAILVIKEKGKAGENIYMYLKDLEFSETQTWTKQWDKLIVSMTLNDFSIYCQKTFPELFKEKNIEKEIIKEVENE